MGASLCAGDRCMYRCVVVRSRWLASSWMALAVAPCIATCEQKEWRRIWIAPVDNSNARRWARSIHMRMILFVGVCNRRHG